jgi:putative membrane protein
MMWGYGGFGLLWMALLWASVILLVVWAIRRPEANNGRTSRAMDILEERFARGELDAEEFESRRRELVR